MDRTRVCLSTQTYDLAGWVMITNIDESKSRTWEYTRRLTRQATLDTGAYIDDRGYAAGDRSLLFAIVGDEAMYNSLLYLVKNYASLWISLPDGAFTGNIRSLDRTGGRIMLNILLEATA